MALIRGDVALGDDRKKAKMKHRAALHMAGGTVLEGHVFTLPRERLLDLMNDPRNFIPFERLDGRVVLVSKSQVEQAYETDEFESARIAATSAEGAIAEAGGEGSGGPGAGGPVAALQAAVAAAVEESAPAMDPYRTLGVNREMSGADIQAAFRRYVERIHPDRVREARLHHRFVELAEKLIEEATEAYHAIRAERIAARQNT